MVKKILITGADGFIGRHVVRELKNSGYDLSLMLHHDISDELSGMLTKNDSFVIGDLNDTVHYGRAFEDVEAVVHLAANTNISAMIKDPSLGLSVTEGTLLLLATMLMNNIKKFLYFSAGRIYGNPISFPIDESHPLDPIEPYGMDKLKSEVYAKYFAKGGIESTFLRLYSVYGSGQLVKPEVNSGVIAIFADRILHEQPITIFGDGSLQRNFIYVDDLCGIVNRVLKEEVWGETMNVGSDRQVTIGELPKIIGDIIGIEPKIEYKGPLPGDSSHYPSLERLNSRLPGLKFMPLEEGIERYLDWVKKQGL